MLNNLSADFKIIFERDPAARHWLEVLVCYPGIQALFGHQVAHWLYCHQIPFIPRGISYLVRFVTGIEIHPGAKIGKGVFIDHGMGVVIGETAVVGDYSTIYQGVTLGGTGKEQGKRHPTVGQNVVLGAGAKVLGNISIGDRVRLGAGSVVLRNIPSDCTVVGVPGRIVRREGKLVNDDSLPDPEAEVIRALFDKIQALEAEVNRLKASRGVVPAVNTHRLKQKDNLLIENFLDGAGI
ncbi:serine O-acetyltransferase [Synechocystis sp. PCC 7509]|uniref:serine O-acetyltransferase n=1 Tax=Synechocystis sp. PCC 7509 TaxID=927677 RepID=UPI0002AC43F8